MHAPTVLMRWGDGPLSPVCALGSSPRGGAKGAVGGQTSQSASLTGQKVKEVQHRRKRPQKEKAN